MSTKKRIAIISTWYPPNKSVATQRIVAMVEFLKDRFEIHVFTLGEETKTENHDGIQVHYLADNKWFKFVKPNAQDSRVKHYMRTLSRIVLFKLVKPLKKWRTRTAEALSHVHKTNPFDAIISSYSPEQVHEAVLDFFEQTHTRLPWIADMRDEMSKNPGLSPAQQEKMRALELRINEYASAVTTVSLPILKDFQAIFTKVHHFDEVRNGYNHTLELSDEVNTQEPIKIGYFGIFYGENKPHHFLNAWKSLPDYKSIELHCYGTHHNFAIPQELKPLIHFHPSLSYLEAIKAMNQQDFNLLTKPIVAGKGVFSGKIFDYISAKKPILATVDMEDVAAQLILDFEAGYCAKFDDEQAISELLKSAIHDKKQGVKRIASEDNRKSLHRAHQIAKLELLLDKII